MSTLTEQRERATRSGPEQTPSTDSRAQRPGRGLLMGLVVVLTAAVIGLAAWVIIDRTSTSDTAVTDDVRELLDAYYTAWNTADGDAYLELVTEDGVFVTSDGADSVATQAASIDSLGPYDWRVEGVGEPIMTGDGPWYVAQVDHLTAKMYPEEGYLGISTFTIVEEDGTLLIERHVYTGQY